MDREYDPSNMNELTRLVREAMGDRADMLFESFAAYNPALDRIEVWTRDCGHRWVDVVMNIFELLVDNYPEDREEGTTEEVGFGIWPVKRICKLHGLSTNQADIKQLLDLILREWPKTEPQILIARQLLEQLDSTEIELR
jgi:hypothetical protein